MDGGIIVVCYWQVWMKVRFSKRGDIARVKNLGKYEGESTDTSQKNAAAGFQARRNSASRQLEGKHSADI